MSNDLAWTYKNTVKQARPAQLRRKLLFAERYEEAAALMGWEALRQSWEQTANELREHLAAAEARA